MANRINEYEPDFVTPPGQTLSDKLEEMGMKQVKLALRIGLSQKHICGIIKGSEPITQETAIGLERVTGISARFWNDRESQYRERLAKLRDRKELQQHTKVLKEVPIDELIKRGYIKQTKDKAEILRQVLSFFGVKGISELRNQWKANKVAARRPKIFEKKPGYTAAWLRIGEIRSQQISCADFNVIKFKQSIQAIRSLTLLNPDEFVPKMKTLCANSGVALVLVPEIENVTWFGASWWQSPKKAVIELNLRGKKEDKFWFSFFHEAGHVLQQKKKTIFVDEQGASGESEANANRFAADILIPRKYKDRLPTLQTQADVKKLAEELGISPGIVVGQHQWLTENYNKFNGLKRTFVWVSN